MATDLRTLIALGVLVVLGVFSGRPAAVAADASPDPIGTGRIVGVAVDESGQPLPWPIAAVGKPPQFAQGDGDGGFLLRGVPAGVHDLTVFQVAADTVVVRGLIVEAGKDLRVRVVLPVRVIQLEQENFQDTPTELDIQKDVAGTRRRFALQDTELRPVSTLAEALESLSGVQKEEDGLHVQGGRVDETKQLIDGMPASDPLSGSASGSLSVSLNALASLELQSAGMDAEHGDALSGIVILATREGGDDYSGVFTFHTDDFGAPDKTYFNYDNIALGFGGPVPGLGHWLRFFVSAEGAYEDTYLSTGEDRPARQLSLAGKRVALFRDRQNNALNGQAKLTALLGNGRKLSAEYLFSRSENDWYHHAFSRSGYWSRTRQHWWYEPIDSTYTFYDGPSHVSELMSRNDQYKAVYTHPLTERSFLTVRAGLFRTRYREGVGDKAPEQYVSFNGEDAQRDPANLFFVVEGDYPVWERRESSQYTVRADYQRRMGADDPLLTSHELRAGGTFHLYDVSKDARRFPSRDRPLGTSTNRFHERATGGVLYIRDRLRYGRTMVVTAGLRFDVFDPGENAVRVGNVRLSRLGLPTSGVRLFDRWRTQMSPRLGVSYPFTDKSVLHFTYGRFFQLSRLEYLYDFLDETSPSNSLVGNPFLEPETNISYQFGVRRSLSEVVLLDASIFFKDIFGWIGTRRLNENAAEQDPFAAVTYFNQDYGSVRGLELSVRKNFSGIWQGGLSYTLSRATGSSSDVNQGLTVIQDGQDREPIREVPLGWDRTHLLSAHLYFADPGVWGVNFDLSAQSGAPVTPVRLGQRNLRAEDIGTLRLPASVRLSVRANKQYSLYGQEFRLFLEGRNLLDRRNPAALQPDLFPDPDSEYYRQYFTEFGELGGAYNLSDTIGLAEDVLVPLNDPRVWGPPRSFRVGVQLEW